MTEPAPLHPIFAETYLSLNDACEYVHEHYPYTCGGKLPHVATLTRWATPGIGLHGRVLLSVKVGATRYTSTERLDDLIQTIIAEQNPDVAKPAKPAAKRKRMSKAARKLSRAGA